MLTALAIPKVRLWISYGLILLVIVSASLAITNYIKYLRLENANTKMTAAFDQQKAAVTMLQGVVDAQRASLAEVQRIRDLDSDVLEGLQDDLGALGKRDNAINNRLAQLERNNVEVRKFMRTPVPDVAGGGCLLDNSCGGSEAGSDDGQPAASPAKEVPATGTDKGQGAGRLPAKQQQQAGRV